MLGNLAILAAALLWAASIVHIGGAPLGLHAASCSSRGRRCSPRVLLTPIALATTPLPHVEWSPSFVLLLLYLGVPGTAVAYWAVAMASRHLPAVTTSLGLLATPVVSVITATLWLGEPLTLTLVLAIVLVLGGVAIGVTGSLTYASRSAGRRDEMSTTRVV